MLGTAICLSEDRVSEHPAVELAICSAAVSNPDLQIIAFLPYVDEHMLKSFDSHKNVEVRITRATSMTGWNVKPRSVLNLLQEGYNSVWWIDSDVLVLCNLQQRYGVKAYSFLVTEEALGGKYSDNGSRAQAWGFDVRRHFGHCLNSGVFRAGQAHADLLSKWAHLMEQADYLEAQSRPFDLRPIHMASDQDVLTAVLCASEATEVDVGILRRGRDIIQYLGPFGYTMRERILNLLLVSPAFIHSLGPFKPWRGDPMKRRAFDELMNDTSPYCGYALNFLGVVTNALEWARPKTIAGRVLKGIGLGVMPLRGLPLSFVADCFRLSSALRALGSKSFVW